MKEVALVGVVLMLVFAQLGCDTTVTNDIHGRNDAPPDDDADGLRPSRKSLIERMQYADEKARDEAVKEAIATGQDVSGKTSSNKTVLHLLLSDRKTSPSESDIRALIKKVPDILKAKDDKGVTPFVLATEYVHGLSGASWLTYDLFKDMLATGADITDEYYSRESLLHVLLKAISIGADARKPEILLMLKDVLAHPDVAKIIDRPDDEGNTPLHYWDVPEEFVTTMLEKGADPQHKNLKGTPAIATNKIFEIASSASKDRGYFLWLLKSGKNAEALTIIDTFLTEGDVRYKTLITSREFLDTILNKAHTDALKAKIARAYTISFRKVSMQDAMEGAFGELLKNPPPNYSFLHDFIYSDFKGVLPKFPDDVISVIAVALAKNPALKNIVAKSTVFAVLGLTGRETTQEITGTPLNIAGQIRSNLESAVMWGSWKDRDNLIGKLRQIETALK